MAVIRVPLSTEARLHAVLGLWDRYEGEYHIEEAIIALGESLDIDAVSEEGYVETVARAALARLNAMDEPTLEIRRLI